MLNLGQINFGLGVDTRALDRAVTDLRNFGGQLDQVAAAHGRLARTTERAMRRQEQAMTGSLVQVQRLNDAVRRSDATDAQRTAMLRQTAAAYNELTNQLTMGARSTLAYQRAMESFTARLALVKRELAGMNANAGQNRMAQMMRDLASATVVAVGPLSGFGARLAAITAVTSRSGVALAAFVVGVTSAGAALGALSAATIRTAIDLERVNNRLLAQTGSIEAAREEYQFLKDVANRTGQEFVSLAQQYTRFNAAVQGTSLEGDKAREIFENIAFAVGKFGVSVADSEGTFRALEQMVSKGIVQAEELRGQMGDRLPGAFKAAADAMGVSTRKLNEMLKKGKVLSEEFLVPFSREIKKRLAGDGTEAVDTIQASINRLTNSFTAFKEKFDETFGVSKTFKAVVEALTGTLNFLTDNMRGLVAVLAGVSAGFVALMLPRVLSGIFALTAAVPRLTAGFLGLTAALATGGLVAWLTSFVRIIAVVGTAAYSLGLLNSKKAEAAEADEKLKAGSDALIATQERQGVAVRKSAKDFMQATAVKIQALLDTLLAMQKADQAQREFIEDFDSGTKKWHERGLDEWYDRLVMGAKQRNGGMKDKMAPVIKDIDEMQKRWQKLSAVQNAPKGSFLGDDEKISRSARALRDAGQAINELQQANMKMLQGPRAFEEWQEAFEIKDKIQQFKDRLQDAGVATSDINAKVAQYTQALEANYNLQKRTFASMKALHDAMRSSAENAFGSMADAFANAITSGKLSAQTFVDIVKDMTNQILSTILRMAVMNPIMNSIFGGNAPAFSGSQWSSLFGFAKGGAFSGGVQFMAKGGLLNGPTAFGTSRGVAIGGEAGTEAVMPLARSSSGHLGVRAVGGKQGGASVINNIILPPGTTARTSQRQGSGGQTINEIVVDMINKGVGSGQTDQTFRSRFGGRTRLAGVS